MGNTVLNNNTKFAILGGYMIGWCPNELSHYDWLVKQNLVSDDNFKNVICGHVDNDAIYFYTGNKEVNDRVKAEALKWHSKIAGNKQVYCGEHQLAS